MSIFVLFIEIELFGKLHALQAEEHKALVVSLVICRAAPFRLNISD